MDLPSIRSNGQFQLDKVKKEIGIQINRCSLIYIVLSSIIPLLAYFYELYYSRQPPIIWWLRKDLSSVPYQSRKVVLKKLDSYYSRNEWVKNNLKISQKWSQGIYCKEGIFNENLNISKFQKSQEFILSASLTFDRIYVNILLINYRALECATDSTLLSSLFKSFPNKSRQRIDSSRQLSTSFIRSPNSTHRSTYNSADLSSSSLYPKTFICRFYDHKAKLLLVATSQPLIERYFLRCPIPEEIRHRSRLFLRLQWTATITKPFSKNAAINTMTNKLSVAEGIGNNNGKIKINTLSQQHQQYITSTVSRMSNLFPLCSFMTDNIAHTSWTPPFIKHHSYSSIITPTTGSSSSNTKKIKKGNIISFQDNNSNSTTASTNFVNRKKNFQTRKVTLLSNQTATPSNANIHSNYNKHINHMYNRSSSHNSTYHHHTHTTHSSIRYNLSICTTVGILDQQQHQSKYFSSANKRKAQNNSSSSDSSDRNIDKRNKHQQMIEWIEYHRMIGVEHFFIYNYFQSQHIDYQYQHSSSSSSSSSTQKKNDKNIKSNNQQKQRLRSLHKNTNDTASRNRKLLSTSSDYDANYDVGDNNFNDRNNRKLSETNRHISQQHSNVINYKSSADAINDGDGNDDEWENILSDYIRIGIVTLIPWQYPMCTESRSSSNTDCFFGNDYESFSSSNSSTDTTSNSNNNNSKNNNNNINNSGSSSNDTRHQYEWARRQQYLNHLYTFSIQSCYLRYRASSEWMAVLNTDQFIGIKSNQQAHQQEPQLGDNTNSNSNSDGNGNDSGGSNSNDSSTIDLAHSSSSSDYYSTSSSSSSSSSASLLLADLIDEVVDKHEQVAVITLEAIYQYSCPHTANINNIPNESSINIAINSPPLTPSTTTSTATTATTIVKKSKMKSKKTPTAEEVSATKEATSTAKDKNLQVIVGEAPPKPAAPIEYVLILNEKSQSSSSTASTSSSSSTASIRRTTTDANIDTPFNLLPYQDNINTHNNDSDEVPRNRTRTYLSPAIMRLGNFQSTLPRRKHHHNDDGTSSSSGAISVSIGDDIVLIRTDSVVFFSPTMHSSIYSSSQPKQQEQSSPSSSSESSSSSSAATTSATTPTHTTENENNIKLSPSSVFPIRESETNKDSESYVYIQYHHEHDNLLYSDGGGDTSSKTRNNKHKSSSAISQSVSSSGSSSSLVSSTEDGIHNHMKAYSHYSPLTRIHLSSSPSHTTSTSLSSDTIAKTDNADATSSSSTTTTTTRSSSKSEVEDAEVSEMNVVVRLNKKIAHIMHYRKSADISPCAEMLETAQFTDLLYAATDVTYAHLAASHDNGSMKNKNDIHSSSTAIGGGSDHVSSNDINNHSSISGNISKSSINSIQNAFSEIWSENLCRNHRHHRNNHQSFISPPFIKTLSERMEQAMSGLIPLYVQHHHD